MKKNTEQYPKMPVYYIGWDVGGWNCDNNPNSRDALCILDEHLDLVGRQWRGNLRESINEAASTKDWLLKLFNICSAQTPVLPYKAIISIDTPLGFSIELIDLLTRQRTVAFLDSSESNPYLFRYTERFLFRHGLRPLSPIKDMIGSQATKGMHVVAKFAPQILSCGVWSDGSLLTVIEAYPSPCKHSATMKGLLLQYAPMDHVDKQDALTCALLGFLFDREPNKLFQPDDAPNNEGWIWVPRDAINHS
jgi:hypothetical protein